MFKFTRAHFKKCVNHPFFQEGHRLAIEYALQNVDISWYRGESKTIEPFMRYGFNSDVWKNLAFTGFKYLPLPYLIAHPDLHYYRTVYGEIHPVVARIQEDANVRNKLLNTPCDIFDPAWLMNSL